VLYTLP